MISLPLITQALKEDAISRDITSLAIFGKKGGIKKGVLLAKQDLILSGWEVAKKVFKQVSPRIQIKTKFHDGSRIKKGQKIAEISGNIFNLLRVERVALNFLQHLSGIATLTYQFVQKIKPYRAKILDTRKTVPGLRILEKKAVRDGGGQNHRFNLSDMFLIKDNHIAACGGVGLAIKKCRRLLVAGRRLIEVEVKNIRELKEALTEKPGIILLDNMKLSQIKKAVKITGKECLLEVSGGVNLKNVRKIAQTGVDRISVGALTHSAPAADISLEIEM